MKRLVLIAEESLIIQALILGLRSSGEFMLIGPFPPAVPAHDVVATAPDAVLLDDDPHGVDQMVDLIREVKAQRPAAVLMILTLEPSSSAVAAAFAAGATGAVSKSAQPAAVTTLIRETIEGRILNLSRSASDSAAPAGAPREAESLSRRELEVLRLVAGGYTNAQIAQRLWVTEQTVKFHLSNIYRKLGVGNRTEAAHYAHVNRIVQGPVPGG